MHPFSKLNLSYESHRFKYSLTGKNRYIIVERSLPIKQPIHFLVCILKVTLKSSRPIVSTNLYTKRKQVLITYKIHKLRNILEQAQRI